MEDDDEEMPLEDEDEFVAENDCEDYNGTEDLVKILIRSMLYVKKNLTIMHFDDVVMKVYVKVVMKN